MVKNKTAGLLVLGFLFFSTLAWAGDISRAKLSDVSLGMKPEEIISILGEPNLKRSEGLNTEGKSVQRFEYNVTYPVKQNSDNDNGDRFTTSVCSLMIVDGVLVRIDRQR